jgi:hypothetical protein
MLAIIGLGFTVFTLNWFDVATAFPLIGAEFNVGLVSLSCPISLFIVGYGPRPASTRCVRPRRKNRSGPT